MRNLFRKIRDFFVTYKEIIIVLVAIIITHTLAFFVGAISMASYVLFERGGCLL